MLYLGFLTNDVLEMIYYASDRSYRRLLALFEVATMSDYKQEVIGGALGNYLIEGLLISVLNAT